MIRKCSRKVRGTALQPTGGEPTREDVVNHLRHPLLLEIREMRRVAVVRLVESVLGADVVAGQELE